jgi:hypothetical protein
MTNFEARQVKKSILMSWKFEAVADKLNRPNQLWHVTKRFFKET